MIEQKELQLIIKEKGAANALKSLGEINKEGLKGKGIFAATSAEAGKLSAAIGGLYIAAVKGIQEPIRAWQDWQKEMLNTNRMMGLTDQELKVFESRMLSLANGPLGAAPNLLAGITEGMYTYSSSLGEVKNQAVVMDDIAAATEAAAVSNSNFNMVLGQGAKIASVFATGQGSIRTTMEQAMMAEKIAIATFEEMTDATYIASGGFNLLGYDAATTMGAIATATKVAGMNANRSATMLKMFNTRLFANMDALREAGIVATDWAGILMEVRDKGLLTSQMFKDITGPRYYAGIYQMAMNAEMLASTIDQVRNSTGNLEKAWDAYNAQTLTESIRVANKHEAAMARMGQELEKFKPQIDEFQSWMQLTLAQLAGFFMKNQELVIGSLLTIRAAMMAFKASNPLGWAIAAVELLVGIGLLITSAFEDVDKAALAAGESAKKMLEDELAATQAAREGAQAELEKAQAASAGAAEIAALTQRTEELIVREKELTDAITKQAVANSLLRASVAAGEVGTEIGGGAGGAAAEKVLRQLLITRNETLKSEEAIVEQQKLQSTLAQDIAQNAYDEDGLRASIVKYLAATLGVSEEYADGLIEQNIDLEEAQMFLEQEGVQLAANKEQIANQKTSTSMINDLLREQFPLYQGVNEFLETRKDMNDQERVQAEIKLVNQGLYLDRLWDELGLKIKLAEASKEQFLAQAALNGLTEAGIANITTRMDASIAAMKDLQHQAAITKGQTLDALHYSYTYTADTGEEEEGIVPAAAGEAEAAGAVSNARKLAEATAYLDARGVNHAGWDEKKIIAYYDEYMRRKTEAEAQADKEAQDRRDALGGLETRTTQQESATAAEEEAAQERIDEQAAAVASKLDFIGAAFSNLILKGGQDFLSIIGSGLLNIADMFIQTLVQSELTSLLAKILPEGGLLGSIFGFAEGGVVDRPTLAMIGEGGEREYVIPESRLREAMNRYGSLGPAYAAAQVSGQTVQAAPQVTVQESVPQITLSVSNEGLLVATEKARRARQIKQGVR